VEACKLVDCLVTTLSDFGLPLPADAAGLADLAASYLWRGCYESTKSTSQDIMEADYSMRMMMAFRGYCQCVKLNIIGKKDIDQRPNELSAALKILKPCFNSDSMILVSKDVKSLFDLIVLCMKSKEVIDCKNLCLSLACCLTEMTIIYGLFLLQQSQFNEAASAMSALENVLKDKLNASVFGQFNCNTLLVLLKVFDTFVKLDSATGQSCEDACQTWSDIALKCAKQLAVKLKDLAGVAKKVHHNTFITVLHVLDHVVDALIGSDKMDNVAEDLAEAVKSLLDLRSQLCSLCNALYRGQMLSDSRSRLAEFEQTAVDAEVKKLELHSVQVQKDFTGSLLHWFTMLAICCNGWIHQF
jgi:hypothetical protein